MSNPSSMGIYDVLILGGGPAGLSVATGLARQLYTAVLFNSGSFRNAKATHMHNVLGWDHADPATFRAKAKSDLLARYSTVKFEEDTRIESVKKLEKGGFVVRDDKGSEWTGKKVVLATGVKDVYPDIQGYGDCWGIGIFHCLFCHGYEQRGAASAGVLAVSDLANVGFAGHMARMAHRLAKNITIYTHGNTSLAKELEDALKESVRGFKIDNRKIVKLEKGAHDADVTIHFDDSTSITHAFLAHKPKSVLNGPFAEQLAIELNPDGTIKVSQPFPSTSVDGVFAVGDCTTPVAAVSVAASQGGMAAAGLAFQLQMDPF